MALGPTIEGKTIRMRPVLEADAETTFKMRSDPEKSRYIHSATGTVEDQRVFIRKQIAKEGDYLFIIESLDGKAIGMKGVYDYDPIARTVETGRFICFGSPIQSVESLYLSFDFAFDDLGVDCIMMSALEKNANMRSMQDRFGVEIVRSEFNPDFGCDSIYSVLTRRVYTRSRLKAQALVDRFAARLER